MKFNVLSQTGNECAWIRHTAHKLCVGGCLFAPCSVSVGALPELLVGLWFCYLLRFVLCDSISDSSVFGLTGVLERPESHNNR